MPAQLTRASLSHPSLTHPGADAEVARVNHRECLQVHHSIVCGTVFTALAKQVRARVSLTLRATNVPYASASVRDTAPVLPPGSHSRNQGSLRVRHTGRYGRRHWP